MGSRKQTMQKSECFDPNGRDSGSDYGFPRNKTNGQFTSKILPDLYEEKLRPETRLEGPQTTIKLVYGLEATQIEKTIL